MTTVRLDEDDDRLLERLRAKYILLGKKMTKKDILCQLIREEALKYEDVLQETLIPLEGDPTRQLLQNPLDWGVADTSDTVNEYLYKKGD